MSRIYQASCFEQGGGGRNLFCAAPVLLIFILNNEGCFLSVLFCEIKCMLSGNGQYSRKRKILILQHNTKTRE